MEELPGNTVEIREKQLKCKNLRLEKVRKMRRLQQYIKRTKDLRLRIKPTENIQVYASAEASFGPFKDGKSNTGLVLTVGFPNAPTLAKSSKQNQQQTAQQLRN
jgi:hypothetical protein